MQEGACKRSMQVVVTDADNALMQSCILCMDFFGTPPVDFQPVVAGPQVTLCSLRIPRKWRDRSRISGFCRQAPLWTQY